MRACIYLIPRRLASNMIEARHKKMYPQPCAQSVDSDDQILFRMSNDQKKKSYSLNYRGRGRRRLMPTHSHRLARVATARETIYNNTAHMILQCNTFRLILRFLFNTCGEKFKPRYLVAWTKE